MTDAAAGKFCDDVKQVAMFADDATNGKERSPDKGEVWSEEDDAAGDDAAE